jgi:predicted ABC-type ATPase
MNDKAGITSISNTSHEEMKQTALKRDEEHVQAIVNHLNETMTDPFDIEAHPPCLMNISTGIHATREVQDSLLSAVNEGEKKCRNFVKSALSVGQSVNLLSIVTSSQLLAKTRVRLKTISGLI